MIRNSRFAPHFALFFLLIVPVVLVVLPARYFDDGDSICLSVMLLDMECYACGMTRSIMHLIHLDFPEAFYYNPLGFIVLPIMGWIWLKYVWEMITRIKSS